MDLKLEGMEHLNERERLEYMLRFSKAVIETEADPIAMMANVSAVIMATIGDLNWAGFYRVLGDELLLGPFQGLPACTRLKGEGVCVAAWRRGEAVCVENVHDFDGHVACDSASNSELVVPIRVGGAIAAVLDLDAPKVGRFGALEEAYFTRLGAYMEEALAKKRSSECV